MSRGPVDNVNQYGLHTSRLNSKLRKMLVNTTDYRPDEAARDLVKMAYEIDSQITISTAQALEIEHLNCG